MQTGLLSTFHRPVQNRNGLAWGLSLALFSLYFLLYLPDYNYFPDYLNQFLQQTLGLRSFDKWNLYGLLYSLAMLVGGWFMLQKHGNSRYHRIRTFCLIGVQVVFAFTLPLILKILHYPELYLSYFWPLSYSKLFPDELSKLPAFAAAYFVVGSLIAVPLIAWFKGKRFYCSWICGCGGLAETFGDPWRHLSDKSAKAWRIEQISIYSVLALVLLVTGLQVADASSRSALAFQLGNSEGSQRMQAGLLLADAATRIKALPEGSAPAELDLLQQKLAAPLPDSARQNWEEAVRLASAKAPSWKVAQAVEQAAYGVMPYGPLSGVSYKIKSFYAFFIGALFSGAAGVGLYPLMGTRVWCRFGCPMAAILGLVQKFGRFRITVKKDMCIACGNCSTYCEMGIDVRAYAMANLDIQRASCVGCGMCAHVCPRGVLKLETRPSQGPGERVQEWVLDL